MKTSTHPILAVAAREIRRIIHNKSSRNLLVFVPVCVFILLSFIYTEGIIEEIPVAVFDKDNTQLSRTITRFIEASPQTEIVKHIDSGQKIDEIFLQNDNIEAIFIIPKNLTDEVMQGKSGRVGIYTNSTNIIFANTIYKEAMTVLNTVSTGILRERFVKNGLTKERADQLALPIRVQAKPLYNANYNYLNYLVPGLMTVLLQMIIFFITTRSLNHEFNQKTMTSLFDLAQHKPLNIILGKVLAYFIFSMLLAFFLLFVFFIFSIPISGNIFYLLLYLAFFVVTIIVLGMFLSTIVVDEIVALDIAFFYNSPAFVFSGFTFPIFAMPIFDKLYAQVVPYTHFLYGFFKLYQMDTPVKYAFPEIIILSLFLIIGFLGTYVGLKFQLSKEGIVKKGRLRA